MMDFVAMARELLGQDADVDAVQSAALKLAAWMPTETPKAVELKRRGGEWLGAARNWIQWHRHNGSDVTWGSQDILSPPMTVADVEDMAAHVAAAAMHKQASESQLESSLRARWNAESIASELRTKLSDWQNRLAPYSAFGSIKDRSASVRSEMIVCIERLK